MILDIKVEYIDHPYKDELLSRNEKWCKIKLFISENELLIKTLLDIQWDLNVLVNWVIENEHALNCELPPELISGIFLAKDISEFYENLVDDETLLDDIYKYRVRHGLRFGLRGTDIAEIYIGLNSNKLHTVSLFNDVDCWNYEISIDGFLKKIYNLKS